MMNGGQQGEATLDPSHPRDRTRLEKELLPNSVVYGGAQLSQRQILAKPTNREPLIGARQEN
jgi:hypothetical protein